MDGFIIDRIWELASAEINNQADESELQELKSFLSDWKVKRIKEDARRIQSGLQEAITLQHSSVVRSWEQISRIIRNNRFCLFIILSRYVALLNFCFLMSEGTLSVV